jgi:hypothetical protein
MPKAATKRKGPIVDPLRPNRPTPPTSDKPEIDLPSLPQRIKQATDLIRKSSKIVVLIGAGVSTSSGIPGELPAFICPVDRLEPRLMKRVRGIDFRSPDGLYAAFRAGTSKLSPPHSSNQITLDTPSITTRTSSRPRRAAATIGETSRRESTNLIGSAGGSEEGGFDLIDPQELMSIHVFRTHP